HVEPPEVVARGGHERVSDAVLTHVSDDCDATLPHVSLRRTCPVRVDLGEHDGRAFRDEPFDDAAPDAGTAPGNDRNLAVDESHALRALPDALLPRAAAALTRRHSSSRTKTA